MRTSNSTTTLAAQERSAKACGHERHIGTCPTCQRAQLDRWRTQLVQAHDARGTDRNN